MSKLNFPFTEGEFYIDIHDNRSSRPWAIWQSTKYGPRQFDIYITREQAEIAAKHYDLTMVDKPE